MQLLVNGLIAGSLAALIAGGLALVYGVLGIFNLALGQMALISGYCTWWLHQVTELSLPVSIIGGLVAGAIISWISFEIFVNPFYKRHHFVPLVTTIALGMILDSLILLVFEERPRSILPGLKETYNIAGAAVSFENIVLVCFTVSILLLFAYVLHSTAMGRRIRAVVQNDYTAISLGIPAARLHRALFITSGILAGLGGIYLGIDQNLTPVFAFPITVKAYAAIIAGGKGNFWGAIVCAYLIALLEQIVIGIHWFNSFYVPAGYQQSVALLFIIFFLVLRPQGLFSTNRRAT